MFTVMYIHVYIYIYIYIYIPWKDDRVGRRRRQVLSVRLKDLLGPVTRVKKKKKASPQRPSFSHPNMEQLKTL